MPTSRQWRIMVTDAALELSALKTDPFSYSHHTLLTLHITHIAMLALAALQTCDLFSVLLLALSFMQAVGVREATHSSG